ncbi:MAG: hypothetical protein AABX05_04330 [Nanoarchaeota archaeon]
MSWLFGKKKVVPKAPFPQGREIDEKALRFPAPASSERIIEPDKVKEAAGFSRPVAFPEEEELEQEPVDDDISMPPTFPAPGRQRMMPQKASLDMMPKQELYVKVDVYQKMLAEMDDLRRNLADLGEASKNLQTSEYNEEHNFNKLRKTMKSLHDNLLHADKTLFKAQGD